MVDTTKEIFKLITNVTEKLESVKSVIEIITEIITEATPILKEIFEWFDHYSNPLECQINTKQKDIYRLPKLYRKSRGIHILRNLALK